MKQVISTGLDSQIKNALVYFDLGELCEMVGDFILCDIQSGSIGNEQMIPSLPTRFHSKRLPDIPLGTYLKRITKSIPGFDALVLLLIIVYYKRLKRLKPVFEFDLLMVHRFAAAIICVACKFTSDYFFSNAYYAKICGVSANEMNVLELEFLLLMGWKIVFSKEDIDDAIHSIKAIDFNV